MDLQVSDFFFQGSPFCLNVDPHVIDLIKKDLREDPTYYPGEAIAKHLRWVGLGLSITLWGYKLKIGGKKKEITPEETVAFGRGFDVVLSLLQLSYAGIAHGVSAARQILREAVGKANSEQLLANMQLINDNLGYGTRLLAEDITGRRLVEDFVRRESARSADLYYRVGLETARRTFLAYCEEMGVK